MPTDRFKAKSAEGATHLYFRNMYVHKAAKWEQWHSIFVLKWQGVTFRLKANSQFSTLICCVNPKNSLGCCRGVNGGVGIHMEASPHSPAAKNTDVFRVIFLFSCSHSSSVFLLLLKNWVEKFSVKSCFREIQSRSRQWKLSCPQKLQRACMCLTKCFQCLSAVIVLPFSFIFMQSMCVCFSPHWARDFPVKCSIKLKSVCFCKLPMHLCENVCVCLQRSRYSNTQMWVLTLVTGVCVCAWVCFGGLVVYGWKSSFDKFDKHLQISSWWLTRYRSVQTLATPQQKWLV